MNMAASSCDRRSVHIIILQAHAFVHRTALCCSPKGYNFQSTACNIIEHRLLQGVPHTAMFCIAHTCCLSSVWLLVMQHVRSWVSGSSGLYPWMCVHQIPRQVCH